MRIFNISQKSVKKCLPLYLSNYRVRMKMEIENNSQIRWLRQAIGQYLSVQTLNQAIFAAPKG